MKHKYFVIVSAGLWIAVSEFVRNELLFKQLWVDHYHSLGLEFITLPRNGILWIVWSFLFAWLLFQFLRKFSFKDTFVYSWIIAFVMMWITTYNLQVLPLKILFAAVPLSLLEVWIALLILDSNGFLCSKD